MTWLSTLPVFAVALAVIFVPGMLVLAVGGVRRLNLFALAAPVTLSLSAVGAVLFGLLGLPFSPGSFAALSLVVALVVWGIRLLWVRRNPQYRGRSLAMNGPLYRGGLGRVTATVAIPVGLGIGAFFIARRLIRAFGSPENISQTFDNVFHLGAIHHIATTQAGSSLTLGNLTESSAGFYPAAMHDLFALVQMVAGAPVPVVLNVCTIIVAALVWPLGVMYLTSRIIGARPVPMMAAGILAAGISAFPYLLIGFGVLYSLFMAFAVLPVALGLCIELAGLAARKPASWLTPAFWLLLVLPGLTLAHPSALVALLLFCVPLFAARTLRELMGWHRGTGSRAMALLWLGLSIGFGIIFTIIWLKVRPSLEAAPWGSVESTAQAIGEVIASAPLGAIAAWVVMFFTAIGVYAIVRWQRQRWWVLGIYLLGAILHVFAAGWGSGALRTFMVGVWYNDPFRPAALLPLVTIPIAVIGVDATYRWLRLRLSQLHRSVARTPATRWFGRRTIRAVALIGAWAMIFCIAVVSQSGTLTNVQNRITDMFSIDQNSRLLDTNERALIARLGESVPEDGVIVVNPFTGASLAYALGNRSVVPPHMFGDRSDDEQQLIDHWQEASYNPEICPIVEANNAYWALDFGGRTVIDTPKRFLGVAGLSQDDPGIELVDSEGNARLFRLTACD